MHVCSLKSTAEAYLLKCAVYGYDLYGSAAQIFWTESFIIPVQVLPHIITLRSLFCEHLYGRQQNKSQAEARLRVCTGACISLGKALTSCSCKLDVLFVQWVHRLQAQLCTFGSEQSAACGRPVCRTGSICKAFLFWAFVLYYQVNECRSWADISSCSYKPLYSLLIISVSKCLTPVCPHRTPRRKGCNWNLESLNDFNKLP